MVAPAQILIIIPQNSLNSKMYERINMIMLRLEERKTTTQWSWLQLTENPSTTIRTNRQGIYRLTVLRIFCYGMSSSLGLYLQHYCVRWHRRDC